MCVKFCLDDYEFKIKITITTFMYSFFDIDMCDNIKIYIYI